MINSSFHGVFWWLAGKVNERKATLNPGAVTL